MVCIGFAKVTRKDERLPAGYALTSAGEDLLISLGMNYYRCIVAWKQGARGEFVPVWSNAIQYNDKDKVAEVIAYQRRLKMERRAKRES